MPVKTQAQLLAEVQTILASGSQIKAVDHRTLENDIIDSMFSLGGFWVRSGTDIILVTITDKVGIGTDTPSEKLHVVAIYDADQNTESTFGGRGIILNASHAANFTEDRIEITQAGHIVIKSEDTNSGDVSFIEVFPTVINIKNDTGSVILQETTGNVGIGTPTPSEKLHVVGNALISGTITAANLTSNTYTPTLTNTTNVTSSTPRLASWTRIGNIVTVYGSLDVTTTLAVATEIQLTLPVASDLATAFDLNGTGQASSAVATNAVLLADPATDRARLTFIGLSIGGAGTIYFSFQYQVL